MGRHTDKTRLVIDVSGAVEYQYQRNGNEVILDLAGNAEASAPEPAQSVAGLDLRKTGLSSVSVQTLSDGGARILIVLLQPARVETFELLPHGDRSYRVVVDVFRQGAAQSEENPLVGADRAYDAANTPAAQSRPVTPLPVTAEPTPATTANSPVVQSQVSSVPPARSTRTSFSGTWEHEWAINTVSGGSQKFESLIEPEWNVAFSNGIRATVVGRIRLDGVGDLGPDAYKSFNYSPVTAPLYNTQAASLVLRELYFDIPLASSYLRLGKQQVVWGESDGIKVLDVVNPQSFREFILDDFDDSRIPLWMVNWELPLGDNSNLQLLWIPDLSYDELAEVGSTYFVTSPQLVPQLSSSQSVQFLEPDKPDNIWQDGD